MEVIGALKMIGETQDVGSSGFQKRDFVVTTDEQYPQHILMQFAQDKCNLLANYKVGDKVKVDINLRGREWVNPKGETVYFNTIQAWRISSMQPAHQHTSAPAPAPATQTQTAPQATAQFDDDDDDLPF